MITIPDAPAYAVSAAYAASPPFPELAVAANTRSHSIQWPLAKNFKLTGASEYTFCDYDNLYATVNYLIYKLAFAVILNQLFG